MGSKLHENTKPPARFHPTLHRARALHWKRDYREMGPNPSTSSDFPLGKKNISSLSISTNSSMDSQALPGRICGPKVMALTSKH